MTNDIKVIKKYKPFRDGLSFHKDEFVGSSLLWLLHIFGVAKKYWRKTVRIYIDIKSNRIRLYDKDGECFLIYQYDDWGA